ncbi:DUF6049 family protein [Spirillospora albida]|uniref:DUF6049 family protein n=1 Tax=Spirillospora albida TaxID=58123 RepID=UPI00068B342D|nr:DUF6049 family protein [Spirillospora albida]
MRTVKRAAALAAVLPCLLGAALPLPPQGRAAASPPALTAATRKRPPVTVALTKLTPKTVRADSEIQIGGSAHNRSGRRIDGVTIRLRYRSVPVTSRGQIEQLAKAANPSALPNALPPQPLQVTAAGARQNWTIGTTAKALGLRTFGVYPVGVEVLNSAQQVVGGVTTFLTFVPKGQKPNRVTIGWVLPLIDRQHRANDQTFLDDRLEKDLAAGGRLHDLVTAASTTAAPVTWGIDPALLDDVRYMASRNYVVRPPGSEKSVQKAKSTAAAAWLEALKKASANDPYFTLPYADPDVVALVRAAQPKPARDLAIAFDRRNTGVATEVLGRAANSRIAWPPSGAAGQGTLDQLAGHALKDGGAFLMSSSQFEDPAVGLPNATTALPTLTQGTERALLYDETLNEVVSGGSAAPGGALLTEQRFLAETAMIAAEAPNVRRTVVIAPDRHWNPAGGVAKNLLAFTSGAPWLDAASLGKIEAERPQARTFRGYKDDYEVYELGAGHLEQVRGIARRAATFRAVMTDPINISYERAVLRVQSAAWRGRAGPAKRARVELAEALAQEMGLVRIVTTKNRRVNMAGSSGRLPVTIENTLPGQSVRVRLTATSENSAKLRLGELDADEQTIELSPGERVQRWIPAEAAGNGNFGVHLGLEIPGSGGREFGEGADITVRTTGYGRLALLITGGGLAVLFVGVGVRALRARRRRKAEAAGDGSGSAPGEPGPPLAGPRGPFEDSRATAPDSAGTGTPG